MSCTSPRELTFLLKLRTSYGSFTAAWNTCQYENPLSSVTSFLREKCLHIKVKHMCTYMIYCINRFI